MDTSDNKYKPCYETCLTCNKGGNSENNNCLTCEINYIKKPDYPNSTNCVTECYYSYYYSAFGQYKCTNSSICPDEAHLYIKELKKCTNDCKKESVYKYQYGGKCLFECPQETSPDDNNICKDANVTSCTISDSEIDLQQFLSSGGVDISAKNYAKEFAYTIKHISHYYNSMYSILLYKDINCIDELKVTMPKVDFGDCYNKVKDNLKPPTDDKIIIAIIERENGQKKSTISYNFYHPVTGEKIDADTICKGEEIVIKESVLSQVNNTEVNLDSILFLAQQDINIFNLSDDFYTDICYHFDSPNGKDVPLQDRIKTYYPNITLCDSVCISKGVNLTTMESICECKFNDIMSNELFEGNALIQNALGGVTDLLNSSNLLVLQCYKDVFKLKYILKGSGGFIILSILLIELILAFVFILYDMPIIRKYLFNLTEYFIVYITNLNKNKLNLNLFSNNKNTKEPPKRRKNIKSIKNIKSKALRNNKIASLSIEDNQSMNAFKNESNEEFYKKNILSNKKTKNIFKKEKEYIQIFQKDTQQNLNKLLEAKKLCGGIEMEEYLKPSLDDMEYDDAIKLDKRDFCEYLVEKLKEKQIIMNTFFNKENLLPMSIKIILLLLNIDLYFVVNGLFFSENYISQLFNSEEKETFFSFVPRSVSRFFYATIVGYVVGIIVDCIFIEEKKIRKIFLREKDDPMQLKYEISVTIKSIKTRYSVFIFICLFISIISWYYISCFNNTFPGVRVEWIKSSIVIILIMQVLSILIAFLQAILRSLSFHYKSEKIFKIKSFLP